MIDLFDSFFHGLGVVTFCVLGALMLWLLLSLIKPLYFSIHFHVIAIRGMYKSGRSPKWRYIPWAVIKSAFSDMTCSNITISGAGYYWNLDYDRVDQRIKWRIWDDRTRVEYNEPSMENDSV